MASIASCETLDHLVAHLLEEMRVADAFDVGDQLGGVQTVSARKQGVQRPTGQGVNRRRHSGRREWKKASASHA